MNFTRTSIVASALVTAAFSAHAALIWDESLQGDLSAIGTSIGVLGSGTNTFRGTFSLHRADGGAASADVDAATFEVLDGYAVTGMRAAITATSGQGVFSYTRVAGLLSPSLETLFYADMEGAIFYDYLPTSVAGPYQMYAGGGSASVADDVDFYWDWQVEIVVARVPEPASLALASAALLGIAATRRRKSTATAT